MTARRHVWRIKKQYFHQLKSGEKSLEIRVGYPQIKKVHQGDTITFENYGPNEFDVKRVTVYDNFKELLEDEGVDRVLPGMTFKGALHALQDIYPRDKESLGVYAFELKLKAKERPDAPREYIAASKLLKDGENKKFAKVIAEAYMATDWICEDYPLHTDHFFSKYVPGIFDGKREIITCYIGERLAAVAILKKDDEEKKISTLYVKPDFQKRGIATELLEQCFKWLGTTKPLITIADYKLCQFEKVISKYGWEETEVLADGYYNDHSLEHVFNGNK